MAQITLQQFAKYAEAELHGNSEATIERIVFDSRKLLLTDGALFIAVKGANHDGHSYISNLYSRGVRAFLVEKGFDYSGFTEAGFIIVDNSVQALHKVVSQMRKGFHFPVVGITGSNGKTIVKEWAARILDKKLKVGRSPRSYNSQLGVPLSVFMLEDDCDVALIEAGISLPGEMDVLQRIIDPQIGIITNIGQAHQENFQSIQHKLEEKLKLFKNSEYLLFNIDDEVIHKGVQEELPAVKTLTYGSSADASLQILHQSEDASGKIIKVSFKEKEFDLTIPFNDEASVENVLVSVLLAMHLYINVKQVKEAVKALQPVAMRLEQKEGINNCILIDDAYNSDLTSLELALDFLDQLGAKKGLSKTLILSDIYQSGMDSDEWFGQIQRLIELKGIGRFIGIGPELYKAMGGVNAYHATEEFLNSVHINSFRDEAILLKGSRSFSFEHISSFLEQRRHKTILEIDLNALMQNVQTFRSMLTPGVKMLAMVKAFSYGSGSFEIANVLQRQKVDYLGVAFADEGIELREAGINLPIIVMNPELSSFPLMLQYDLEPEIYSFHLLESFLDAAERQGNQNVSVHIKIDSGMNRMGFLPDEMDKLITRLNQTSLLKVSTVFSHLAGSDEDVHDDFTRQQGQVFNDCCAKLKNGLGYNFIRHILNSAGIERFPEMQMEMVRLGIGMYGVSSNNQELKNVATLKSYVSQLKQVKKSETIGYGRKGVAIEDKTIAIVPVGYADGLNRLLSNGVGNLIINHQKAPIIGNICMDMCMADVTNLKVSEGDEVEIFGEENTIEEMAQKLETIPYEILTSISRRVKRVYFLE
ncbi:bifunctional UDP-N-acetylmuramoyl-tripeptide:D-alanyl-D-alanine ligase/alanine racemase [Carboxylicivirga linearis]|uniref:Alanine racemase n=1 Tax=Carboxylicivirga linearis TaxID=1628157 RepID=A0ABS5JT20_9BACT|nr:bifunctional UDP-N-acetylmuramoyl-tripeptide:D-alanyl-D-alanine ligase/alanine racemase [Carboxylicivirga linearis]MBS2097992.1 bifunctional UDP-N-acetylmuramoyl-tripeptide:D-alanyl-D-alanine ligase/alanine racemase [Carboxylicivirga linearis]